jgi:hypothetical protein
MANCLTVEGEEAHLGFSRLHVSVADTEAKIAIRLNPLEEGTSVLWIEKDKKQTSVRFHRSSLRVR